jgi:hypothetical protein
MMNIYESYEIGQYRRDQLQREADSHRLLKVARYHSPPRPRLIRPLLVIIGRWLVDWGCRLQKRYDLALEMPVGSVDTTGKPGLTC